MEDAASTRWKKILSHLDLGKVLAKEWQKDILRDNFKKNPYPDKQVGVNVFFYFLLKSFLLNRRPLILTHQELGRLSGRLGLDHKWIQKWYNNSRHRLNITRRYLNINKISLNFAPRSINKNQRSLNQNQRSLHQKQRSVNITKTFLNQNQISLHQKQRSVNITQTFLNQNQRERALSLTVNDDEVLDDTSTTEAINEDKLEKSVDGVIIKKTVDYCLDRETWRTWRPWETQTEASVV